MKKSSATKYQPLEKKNALKKKLFDYNKQNSVDTKPNQTNFFFEKKNLFSWFEKNLWKKRCPQKKNKPLEQKQNHLHQNKKKLQNTNNSPREKTKPFSWKKTLKKKTLWKENLMKDQKNPQENQKNWKKQRNKK